MSLEFDTVSLGEHLYIKGRIGWKGLKKDEYLDTGDYRIINATALEEDGINWDDCGYITKERFNESPDIILKEKDILISKDGTIGKLGYVKELDMPSTVASGVFVVRNLNEEYIDTDFLYYYFKSPFFKWFIKSVTEGSVIPHLYQRDFTDMEFNLFDLDTQKRCSEILNNIERKIQINKKINHNLENLILRIYEQWFIKFLKFDFNQFMETDIGKIPEDWELKTIGDYANVKSGFAFKSSWWQDDGIKVIKIKDISSGILDLKNCDYVDSDKIKDAQEFEVKEGDFLIAMTGSIGSFAIVPKYDEQLFVNQRVGKFFLGKNPLEKLPFLWCSVNQNRVHFELINKAHGSVQPNIGNKDIESIPILMPPKDIIDSFNKECQKYFKLILKNQYESMKLIELRDTLLPKLMSGEIDVSEINCDLD